VKPIGDSSFYKSREPSSYLLAEGNFLRFVELEYDSIAFDYYAAVKLTSAESKHDLKLTHDRYSSIYSGFKASLNQNGHQTTGPNQFKIAAALCFSLRRARPVASVEPSFEFARRLLEAKLSGQHEAEGTGLEKLTPEFGYFHQFADEICAFELGLRVAKHLTVQSELLRLNAEKNEHIAQHLMRHYHPSISKSDYTDIIVTLRDHATSPYSLLVLFTAIFAKPLPKA
jgi:hypothetical protein